MVKSLSVEDQNAIAEAVIEAVHIDQKEEGEWNCLVESKESRSFLKQIAKEVEADITEGQTLVSNTYHRFF